MARNTKNEVLVGLYTLTGTALLLLLVFVMGGLDRLLETRSEFAVVFDEVQGLKVGDPVYLFGLKLGNVTELDLLPDGDASKLAAKLSIPSKAREHIRTTSQVSIGKTLTGSISVQISSGDTSGDLLPDDGVLRASPAADFGAIANELDGLLKEGRNLLTNVHGIVKNIDERGSLQSLFDRGSELVAQLKDEIGPIANNAKSTLASADDAIQSVQRVVDKNEESIGKLLVNLDESTSLAKNFISRLEQTPKKLDDSLSMLKQLGERADVLLAENRGGVARLIRDLSNTAANSANLTAEIKRRPWRLLYKPDANEIKALELYDAAWAYNLGAAELHRSIEMLASQLEAPVDDEEHRKLIADAAERVQRSLDKQKKTEEVFWDRLGEAR